MTLSELYELSTRNGVDGEKARQLLLQADWFARMAEFDPRSGEALTQALTPFLRKVIVDSRPAEGWKIHDRLSRLVDHCRFALEHIIKSLNENPRREHSEMPVRDVRELDAACFMKLSTRPGRTIREKLASKPYLLAVRRFQSIDLPENRVGQTNYWLVDDEKGYFIGEVGIRHKLNDALLKRGGHIGYGIRYSEWNKGYGTKMLELALEKAKEFDNADCGRHDINGDELYVSVQRYDTVPYDKKEFENHKKYIDIQYVVSGKETIYVCDTDDMSVLKEYDPDNDYELLKEKTDASPAPVTLTAGDFLVLYPDEPHKPGVCADGIGNVKKIVIKVKHD